MTERTLLPNRRQGDARSQSQGNTTQSLEDWPLERTVMPAPLDGPLNNGHVATRALSTQSFERHPQQLGRPRVPLPIPRHGQVAPQQKAHLGHRLRQSPSTSRQAFASEIPSPFVSRPPSPG